LLKFRKKLFDSILVANWYCAQSESCRLWFKVAYKRSRDPQIAVVVSAAKTDVPDRPGFFELRVVLNRDGTFQRFPFLTDSMVAKKFARGAERVEPAELLHVSLPHVLPAEWPPLYAIGQLDMDAERVMLFRAPRRKGEKKPKADPVADPPAPTPLEQEEAALLAMLNGLAPGDTLKDMHDELPPSIDQEVLQALRRRGGGRPAPPSPEETDPAPRDKPSADSSDETEVDNGDDVDDADVSDVDPDDADIRLNDTPEPKTEATSSSSSNTGKAVVAPPNPERSKKGDNDVTGVEGRTFTKLKANGVFAGFSLKCKHHEDFGCVRDLGLGKAKPMSDHECQVRLLRWERMGEHIRPGPTCVADHRFPEPLLASFSSDLIGVWPDAYH